MASAEELAGALAFLPHGPEFRFIDTLTDLVPGESAAATYTIRGDEAILRGHFPGEPILPGVIVIEAIAQLAGIAAQTESDPLPDLRLAAVRSARIHAAARPGDTLQLEARINGRLGNLVQAEGSVASDGSALASASITLGLG